MTRKPDDTEDGGMETRPGFEFERPTTEEFILFQEYYRKHFPPGAFATAGERWAFFYAIRKGRATLEAENRRLRLVAELSQQFNNNIRKTVALKEPHYTASSILKNMLEKALAARDEGGKVDGRHW